MVGAKRAGFTSKGGTFLQGAILDQDKLDVSDTIKALKDVGYTGDIATELGQGRQSVHQRRQHLKHKECCRKPNRFLD